MPSAWGSTRRAKDYEKLVLVISTIQYFDNWCLHHGLYSENFMPSPMSLNWLQSWYTRELEKQLTYAIITEKILNVHCDTWLWLSGDSGIYVLWWPLSLRRKKNAEVLQYNSSRLQLVPENQRTTNLCTRLNVSTSEKQSHNTGAISAPKQLENTENKTWYK